MMGWENINAKRKLRNKRRENRKLKGALRILKFQLIQLTKIQAPINSLSSTNWLHLSIKVQQDKNLNDCK
jgi:hypothetical protein